VTPPIATTTPNQPSTAGYSNDREIAIDKITVIPTQPEAGQPFEVRAALRNRSIYKLDHVTWQIIDEKNGLRFTSPVNSVRLGPREQREVFAQVTGHDVGQVKWQALVQPGMPTFPPSQTTRPGTTPGTTTMTIIEFSPGYAVDGKLEFPLTIIPKVIQIPPPVLICTPPKVMKNGTCIDVQPIISCIAPKAAINGACENDARNFPTLRKYIGCTQKPSYIAQGPCAALEEENEKYVTGCLAKYQGDVSPRIKAYYQCLVDNSTGGFKDSYQQQLNDYTANNASCAPSFFVDSSCIEYPNCNSKGCTCSKGKVLFSTLCISAPVCQAPQILQGSSCVTPVMPPSAPPAVPPTGTGGGTSSPNGQTWINYNNCVHITDAYFNKCTNNTGMSMKITNTCSVPISTEFCLERINGKWDCGRFSALDPSQTTFFYSCDNTGNYKWIGCEKNGSCKINGLNRSY
jgi:hypothetical protein